MPTIADIPASLVVAMLHALRQLIAWWRPPDPGSQEHDRPPGLDVMAELVRFEREMQIQAFDAIDAKAGIVLGFAGAIVGIALTAPRDVFVVAGVLAAAWSAVMARAVLRAGKYQRQDPNESKRWWLWQEHDVATEELMNTEIDNIYKDDVRIAWKVTRLKRAWGALLISILALVGATLRPVVFETADFVWDWYERQERVRPAAPSEEA